MRVKLSTTITTFIDLGEHGSLEEARKEIFSRYRELEAENQLPEDLLSLQASAVLFDTVDGTKVEHTFVEAL